MEKKRATAGEIQAELQRRIARCLERGGGCRLSGVPRLRAVRPRKSGDPNWTIDGLPNLQPGCFGAIVRIVDEARREYELAS